MHLILVVLSYGNFLDVVKSSDSLFEFKNKIKLRMFNIKGHMTCFILFCDLVGIY